MKNIPLYLVIIVIVLLLSLCSIILTGCTEVERVNSKIGYSADNFEVLRKITVYNTRTNQFLVEITGNFSLQNNDNKELEVICKIGEDKYKKDFIYLNNDTGYIIEDLTGDGDFNKYYYKINYFDLNTSK